MEFNFNINKYFKNEITTVGPRLIPDGFIGDRREIQECISCVSYVMAVLGENSAKAQGLQKVITSAEKLRNSDHVVYVLTDPHEGRGGTGLVLGMLKMGVKHLYVFDSNGQNHEVSPKCVLDFYVHESKQRMGLGKKLFEYMLKVEKTEPQYLAIDKPSPKFLSFLRKHYGLEDVIPQTNNFVVFKGFFKNNETELRSEQKEKSYAAGVSSSSNAFDSRGLPGYSQSVLPSKRQQRNSSVNLNQTAHFGRPALHRPVSTMGLILQHTSQANSPSSFQPGSASEEKNDENNSNLDQDIGDNGKMDMENEETKIVDGKSIDSNDESLRHEIVNPELLQLPTKPEFSIISTEVDENGPPLNCNIQASKPQHLDLKFYHSSLW